jgi:flavodoxin
MEELMTVAVRYLSKTGNTKKVAEAIAAAAGVEALSLDGAAGINETTDVLFLGAAVYAFGVDETVTAFIARLDKDKVKQAAVFSTTAMVPSARPHIKKLLDAQGIPLLDSEFHCRGEFKFLHHGRPNAADLAAAAAFTRSVMQEFSF